MDDGVKWELARFFFYVVVDTIFVASKVMSPQKWQNRRHTGLNVQLKKKDFPELQGFFDSFAHYKWLKK